MKEVKVFWTDEFGDGEAKFYSKAAAIYFVADFYYNTDRSFDFLVVLCCEDEVKNDITEGVKYAAEYIAYKDGSLKNHEYTAKVLEVVNNNLRRGI